MCRFPLLLRLFLAAHSSFPPDKNKLSATRPNPFRRLLRTSVFKGLSPFPVPYFPAATESETDETASFHSLDLAVRPLIPSCSDLFDFFCFVPASLDSEPLFP